MADKKAPKPITLKIHPSADLFPMLSDAELKELGESIKKHGLREPIVVDTEGTLIDGRNRYEAMKRAGIHLTDRHVTIIDFSDPEKTPWTVEEYIVMANLERRMLTREQRRELAGKLAIKFEKQQEDAPKEDKIDTTKKAADLAGVSRRTAASAKQDTLVKIGVREAPTKQNESKKKATKVDQAPPRPPAVVKSLTNAVAAIQETKSKWSEDRRKQAVEHAMLILVAFPDEAKSVGLPEFLKGLFGVPKGTK